MVRVHQGSFFRQSASTRSHFSAKRLECESPLSLCCVKAKGDFRTSKEMLQVCFLIEANFPFRYQRRAAWGLQTLRGVRKDSGNR